MKRINLVLIIIVVICSVFLYGCDEGCDSSLQSTNNSLDGKTEINGDNSNNTALEKVAITVSEKEYSYYTLINEAVTDYEGDWWGECFRIIATNAQMQIELPSPHINPSVFENNYELAIIHLGKTQNGFGYHSLKKDENGYSITYDYLGKTVENDIIYEGSFTTSYVIVPKEHIEYFDGYRAISINARKKDNTKINPLTHSKGELLQKAEAWIIDRNSEIVSQYGLGNFNESLFDTNGKALILYIPNKIDENFVKEITVENSLVKLTVENYIDALDRKNESIYFYQIPSIDTSKLPNDFRVDVTVENISVPSVPTSAYLEPNIDVADAILIAQESFFAHNNTEKTEGFIWTPKCISGESDLYWYILITGKTISAQDDNKEDTVREDLDCIYIISKATGEIVDITAPKYIETEDWNQPTPKKTGDGGVS